MKRTAALLALLPVLLFAACGRKDIALTIYVPPGSGEEFAYSHEEISSAGGSITLSCGEGLGDTEVGVRMENTGDEDASVSVQVQGVVVRIE